MTGNLEGKRYADIELSKRFRCFKSDLKEFLVNNNCYYWLIANDIRSGDIFWLFERTPELEELVQEWIKLKVALD